MPARTTRAWGNETTTHNLSSFTIRSPRRRARLRARLIMSSAAWRETAASTAAALTTSLEKCSHGSFVRHNAWRRGCRVMRQLNGRLSLIVVLKTAWWTLIVSKTRWMVNLNECPLAFWRERVSHSDSQSGVALMAKRWRSAMPRTSERTHLTFFPVNAARVGLWILISLSPTRWIVPQLSRDCSRDDGHAIRCGAGYSLISCPKQFSTAKCKGVMTGRWFILKKWKWRKFCKDEKSIIP